MIAHTARRSICGALRLHFFPLSLVSLLALPDPAQPLARLFATVRQHTPAVALIEDLDAASAIEESALLATALPPLLSGLGALLDAPRVRTRLNCVHVQEYVDIVVRRL